MTEAFSDMKKYHRFWVFAVLAGVSIIFVEMIGPFAFILSTIFSLAAVVIPILMGLDELRKSQEETRNKPDQYPKWALRTF